MHSPMPADAHPMPFAIWPRVQSALQSFLLTPTSAKPLAALRIGVAIVLLVQAVTVHSELLNWYSRSGIFQGDLATALGPSYGPQIADILALATPLGFTETQTLHGLGAAYVVSLVFLALGLGTRFFAALAWFAHWLFMNSADPLVYGVDQYAHIFLFYLILVPAGQAFSLDALLFRRSPAPTSSARLGLRLMQMHLAISYFASGLEKAQLLDWWSGDLIFRALSLPDFRQFDMTWLASYPVFAQLACLGTLAIETGYVVFIWPKRTRRFWLGAIIGLHLGIAVFLGLHFFGAMMCVLNFALFGMDSEN